jgi:GGDEF domain-containing protein
MGRRNTNEVLREIARRLLASVRSCDFVRRYGGEEFLMVLNNCNSPSALQRAEEIRRAIASAPIQTARGQVSVTMSLGILASTEWDFCRSKNFYEKRMQHSIKLRLLGEIASNWPFLLCLLTFRPSLSKSSRTRLDLALLRSKTVLRCKEVRVRNRLSNRLPSLVTR